MNSWHILLENLTEPRRASDASRLVSKKIKSFVTNVLKHNWIWSENRPFTCACVRCKVHPDTQVSKREAPIRGKTNSVFFLHTIWLSWQPPQLLRCTFLALKQLKKFAGSHAKPIFFYRQGLRGLRLKPGFKRKKVSISVKSSVKRKFRLGSWKIFKLKCAF